MAVAPITPNLVPAYLRYCHDNVHFWNRDDDFYLSVGTKDVRMRTKMTICILANNAQIVSPNSTPNTTGKRVQGDQHN